MFGGVRVVLLAVQGGEGGLSGGLPGCAGALAGGPGREAEPDHGENTKGGRAFQTKTARLQSAAVCGRLRVQPAF